MHPVLQQIMGNEPSGEEEPPPPTYQILYRIQFQPGDIRFPDTMGELPRIDPDVEEDHPPPPNLSVELLLTCEEGEVGPIPVSQLASNQERIIDCWHRDVGDPRYCIVVVYRTPKRKTPTWSIHHCNVAAKRRDETTTTFYQHLESFSSGSGVVYSVTLSPHRSDVDVENNVVQELVSHEARHKENHQE